jgi:DNA-binding PadR family transcriptional regulator
MHRPDIWPGDPGRVCLMDVKTVCLGMLTDGDASGYDMKKCFESSFGHFFPAGYGSIYPALATLARNGLVEYELVPQEGKPDRKVYSITVKGREALMEGLSNPNPSHKIRSEFLATLWFAHLLSGEQVHTVIENKIEEIDEFLKLIEEFVSVELPNAGSGAQFVAGFGKHMASAFKQYIEENRDLLANPSLTDVKTAAS